MASGAAPVRLDLPTVDYFGAVNAPTEARPVGGRVRRAHLSVDGIMQRHWFEGTQRAAPVN